MCEEEKFVAVAPGERKKLYHGETFSTVGDAFSDGLKRIGTRFTVVQCIGKKLGKVVCHFVVGGADGR